MVSTRVGSMPSRTSSSRNARARRSPSARLYSSVPRSSQFPSTRTASAELPFKKSATLATLGFSPDLTTELSKSKCTVSALSVSVFSFQPWCEPGSLDLIPVVSPETSVFSPGPSGGAELGSATCPERDPGSGVRYPGFFLQPTAEMLSINAKYIMYLNLLTFISLGRCLGCSAQAGFDASLIQIHRVGS